MTRFLLIALHLMLGASALAAGLALTRDPSGKSLTFKIEWLRRSPFPDYRVPGLFLAFVIGGANFVSLFAQLGRVRPAALTSFLTGLLLLMWVIIQTAIIGVRHWTQPVWAFVFTLLTLLAARQLGIRLMQFEGHSDGE